MESCDVRVSTFFIRSIIIRGINFAEEIGIRILFRLVQILLAVDRVLESDGTPSRQPLAASTFIPNSKTNRHNNERGGNNANNNNGCTVLAGVG